MPSFHSLNTYGFGNESVQPNQNQQNTNMSKDINDPKSALVLSTKCSLRKQQLKAFAALSAHIWTFNQNTFHAWNALPDDVRKNPKTLVMSMRSSSAYQPTGSAGIDVNATIARARVLNTLKKERIAGTNSPSILAWMGANFKYLWDCHRYDTQFWPQLMVQKRIRDGSEACNEREQPWHDSPLCDLNKLTEYCKHNHNDIHNALNWLYRNRRLRAEMRSQIADVLHLQNIPAASRLADAKQRIYQTRAIHWEQSLTPMQLNMAKRMRPSGECVGIELEFIGSKGSPITKWDSDDFDAFPFHSFKHDGSINSTDSDEVVLALQEYTAFINGSNPRDWTQVFDTLKGLTNEGAIVNETCGNHVHLDMRHKSSASYYRTAGKMRDAFTTWAHRLVSHRRSHNRYCGIHNNHTSNRYTAINTQCWSEHRTVEVRIGMPTLNPNKLKYWTRFLQYVVSDRSQVDTFEDFMNSSAPLDLKLYAVSRIKKFEATYINNSLQPIPNFKAYVDALDAVKTTEHDFMAYGKSSTTT